MAPHSHLLENNPANALRSSERALKTVKTRPNGPFLCFWLPWVNLASRLKDDFFLPTHVSFLLPVSCRSLRRRSL